MYYKKQFDILCKYASGMQLKRCDEILRGKKFDELSVNDKVRLSIILIPDELNFFKPDEEDKKEIIFDKDSNEYDMFEKMSQEYWDNYINIMADRGITVEYIKSNIDGKKEDCYKIS